MTNDNTRTKANAVFFSVLMVLSMVAVGFAAAPAVADPTSGDSVTFSDQVINDGTDNNVTVDFDIASIGDSAIIVTYAGNGSNNGNPVIAGVNTSVTGSTETFELTQLRGADFGGVDKNSGEYTAHLVDESESPLTLSAGTEVDNTTGIVAQDTAYIGDLADNARSPGDKDVYDGSTIFQGEDDMRFINETGTNGLLSASDIKKATGDTEGTPLSLPLETDLPTGTYETDDTEFAVNVQTPRITTAEVQLTGDGDDISEVPSDRADGLKVVADYNFEEAENIEVTVEDPSGSDITNQVLNTTGSNANDAIIDSSGGSITVDLADEDAGDYNFVFEGTDDLDYGGVAEEYTLTTTSDDTIALEVASDSVTQADNLEYTVTGGVDGEEHLVLIEESDLRDGTPNADLVNTFRNVGETQEVGLWNGSDGSEINPGDDAVNTYDRDDIEYAYAIVAMDGTQAPGAIETQYLDDSTIDLYTYSIGVQPANLSTLASSEEDDIDFDVEEGDVALDSPTGTYTIGEEVDVAGTATTADEVRLYVKDNNNWEIVEVDDSYNITVDSDDTFEETDVDIRSGDGDGNNIIAFEGRYEIGVIDAQDAQEYESQSDGISTSEITTSDWTTASGSRDSINVVSGSLSADFVTYNGQVAEEDDIIDVNGTAAGQDNVVVAFVDQRGNTLAYEIGVDNDDTFEEDDLSVDLNQGTVSAHVISAGRDGNIGDDDLPDVGTFSQSGASATTSELESYITELGNQGSLSGDQVRDRILTETVDDDASDDLIVTETFRLNDGSVSIDSVYPEGSEASGVNPVAAGDTMVVTGSTNRKADDNSIVIDVLNENGEALASGSTDEWGTDGVYMVTVDTSDLETGSYTVEADTGDNTDTAAIELVESVEEETTEEEETEEETTEEETTEEETTEEETEEETTEEETTEEETTEEEEATDDSTPGFGALVALVALVAAALLATRRRDE